MAERPVPARTRGLLPALVVGCVAAAGAVGGEANRVRAGWPALTDTPYAPSPGAAPIVTLGYRELATDLLWLRARTYFGSDGATSFGVRSLVAAIVALDPRFEEIYNWGSIAMQSITMRLTNDDLLPAVAIIERGMQEFPDNWRLPMRAGEIYALSLKSDDPAQLREWKAKGAALLSRAVRMPGAPKSLGTYVAHLETELGQRDQAIRDLRELITYTSSPSDRDRLVKKLAKLSNTPTEGILYELDVERTRFEAAWHRDRPELPPTMYVVIGPPLPTTFDLADLAVEPDESIEPITPLPALADDVGELAP